MKHLMVGLLLALSLTACSNVTKEKLGLAKKAPNEFMVTTRPPLSVPPEYDLRPVVESAQKDEASLPKADEDFVSKVEETK